MTDPWNHNIHYHPVILRAVPAGTQNVLDVGCSLGILTRQLRPLAATVVGIDLDQPSIDLAAAHTDASGIEYLHGDFLTYPFEPASFDVIASVAALHHMDAARALVRMRELLRPGGTLAIVGLARPRYPADLPAELATIIAHRVYTLTKTTWHHPSPTVWPPPQTYAGIRRLAAALLPGVRYRRRLLWRYTLTWTKPRTPQ